MQSQEMSEKIRQLRQEQGQTLEEIANKVGVGKSTVRKWETGQIANMRRDKIASLAEALHTTPAYLMGWEENTPPQIQTAPAEPELSEVKRQLIEVVRRLPEEKVEALYQVAKALVPQDQPKRP